VEDRHESDTRAGTEGKETGQFIWSYRRCADGHNRIYTVHDGRGTADGEDFIKRRVRRFCAAAA